MQGRTCRRGPEDETKGSGGKEENEKANPNSVHVTGFELVREPSKWTCVLGTRVRLKTRGEKLPRGAETQGGLAHGVAVNRRSVIPPFLGEALRKGVRDAETGEAGKYLKRIPLKKDPSIA